MADAPEHTEDTDRSKGSGNPETAPDGTAASGFPEPPGKDPGDRSRDEDPHHALNTPAPPSGGGG